MTRRDVFGGTAKKEWRNIDIYDDFELGELEDEEEITVHDIDTVLGYTVDVFQVAFPFLFLVALFLGIIMMVGMIL